MLTCKKCKYIVSSDLRFAIINNVCPSCGLSLLGDTEMAQVDMVTERLKSQDFSSGLDKYTAYSLSLFIYNEYLKKDNVKNSIETAEEYVSHEDDPELSSNNLESYEEEAAEHMVEEVEFHETESMDHELGAFDKVSSLDGSFVDNEDLDHKVSRLKRLAKTSKVSGRTGAKVKRAGYEK